MRYIRYAFLAALAVVLVVIAVANRTPVELRLMSDDLARIVGLNATITLPLFVVIFAGIIAGLMIGFVWEWMREYKVRARAHRAEKEKRHLEREVARLRKDETGKDDVLALIEG